MYRKHGPDHVVLIERVWPLIPLNDPDYLEWVALGNAPEDQGEPELDISADLERAEILNEAFDLVMRKLSAQVTPEPETAPEHHFADLMLADETIDDAKARLSQRLRDLRHYLIAPEIKVNEDGSVGLTPGEQVELQDLERRQTLGRWLDA